MVYCKEHGHCDVCGKDDIYVSHHFEVKNDILFNSRMICSECNQKRVDAGIPDKIVMTDSELEIANKIIKSQEDFINQIIHMITTDAKEKLYNFIYVNKFNDVDLNNIHWDYTIAKAMVTIASKDVNKSWPTNCHFNSECKRYEEIINGEKK